MVNYESFGAPFRPRFHARMFDLSPCRTNSKASRYIMYSLPVDKYAFDGNHINLTLQFMMAEIVSDLNKLATEGLKIGDEASGVKNKLLCSVMS